ncbi:ACHE [Symbiodinium natans]|uniref:ACHE protein n=1 Tax=Symbiodinium natans TaxID=878477 RepID=A0A812RE57_9DINO|nr:ACHE [Symbiodinium natans]
MARHGFTGLALFAWLTKLPSGLANRFAVQEAKSTGERCCCNISTEAGQDTLSCEPTQAVTSFMVSFCPGSLTYANDFLPPAARAACNTSSALGPRAQPCRGPTASCDCAETVDARAPSNGLVKGRVLTPSAERIVAGFFGLHYASYSGRRFLEVCVGMFPLYANSPFKRGPKVCPKWRFFA